MFSILKSKPKLSDLIPDGFVDIHSHVLPGIDDGATTVQESIALLKGMKELGFAEIITTPHSMPGVWDNTPETIATSYRLLQTEIAKNDPVLNIRTASEYLLDATFITRLKKNQPLPLKDNMLLVEFSYLQAPMNMFEILFEIQHLGYVPVLAHPERYRFFISDFDRYKKLRSTGCLFQLNLLSTVGYYGTTEAKTAHRLLEQNMIDFVGSDIHHKRHIEAFENRLRYKDSNYLETAISANQLFGVAG